MTHLLAFNPLNAEDYINLLGTWAVLGICCIIFAETGLMIGFFLPGDSLLFVAGVFTLRGETHHLSLAELMLFVPIFAVLGAQLGHYLGYRFGRPLFERPDSKVFKHEYVEKAEFYFNKYGPAKAIIIARFVPIVRTFMNPVAGVLEVPAKTFLVFNAIGGLLWTETVLLVGHLAGSALGAAFNIDKVIVPVTVLIVLVSAIPVIKEVLAARKAKRSGDGADHGERDSLSSSAARHRK